MIVAALKFPRSFCFRKSMKFFFLLEKLLGVSTDLNTLCRFHLANMPRTFADMGQINFGVLIAKTNCAWLEILVEKVQDYKILRDRFPTRFLEASNQKKTEEILKVGKSVENETTSSKKRKFFPKVFKKKIFLIGAVIFGGVLIVFKK